MVEACRSVRGTGLERHADIRFSLFEASGTAPFAKPSDSVDGVWTGTLDGAGQYAPSVRARSGAANFTATIETAASSAGGIVGIGRGTLDATRNVGPRYTRLRFESLESARHDIYSVEVGNGVESVTSDVAILTVEAPLVVGLFSEEADTSAWMLAGPAPTLDYFSGPDTDAWGDALLRVGDILLVGGDFTGIKRRRAGPVTARPFLAALDAVTGRPVTTFQVPSEVDGVVRALVLSPDGDRVYTGGDFGLPVVDAVTGELAFAVSAADGTDGGRVFDIVVTRSRIYLGGDFSRVNGRYRANIARLSLDGDPDPSWAPRVRGGVSKGRAAPVQVVTLSPAEDVVYVGGNFASIDSTLVQRLPGGGRNSILTLDASDGAVRPERFMPTLGTFSLSLAPFDIAVTDSCVIIVCGAPNILTFHSTSGAVLCQIYGTGDTPALQIAGDYVFVGHHGEYFFDATFSPIPPQAVPSLTPRIVVPYKLHSFRISDGSFAPVRAWRISGAFGVWGIVVDEDAIWVAGQISQAGLNDRRVDGLVRFPALP